MITKIKVPEITISVKYKRKPAELYTITGSQTAAELGRNIFDADTFEWKEEFLLICLNRANKVIGYFKVSSGGMTGTIADPKVIFTAALNCTATAILLMHNHPSGNLNPSQADKVLTEKIKEGSQILDITLLDHIIMTDAGYYSFMDEGLI